jgi:DNA-binding CsgD family transcriptional regulator
MISEASLVGRSGEFEAIESFLDDHSQGSGALLLEGELGIGKSTVLGAGEQLARHRGSAVLVARPVESEAPLAFAALMDLLDPVFDSVSASLTAPQRQVLEVALLRQEPSIDPPDPRLLGVATLSLLRHLSQIRPLVIVVDDLPWLDPSSARVLSFALRRLDEEPIRLLGAVRTDSSADPSPLITDAMRSTKVTHVRFGPLSVGAVRTLVTDRTGLVPNRSQLLRMHQLSDGNPFFALEIASSMIGVHEGESSKIPPTLGRLVEQRLEGLPQGTNDVLLVAALAAEPTVPLIVTASSDPPSTIAHLDAAVARNLIGISDGRIAFEHPLIRSVVAERASHTARLSAHRRLAKASTRVEERTRHMALATSGPDEALAVELDGAALVAERRGAVEFAAEFGELAMALTPPGEDEKRIERVLAAARYRLAASEPDRAQSLIDTVIPGLSGTIFARALSFAAVIARYRGEPVPAWRDLLDQAAEYAGDDLGLLAEIRSELALAAFNEGDPQLGVTHAMSALELAETVGNTLLEAELCAGLAVFYFTIGQGVREDLVNRALVAVVPPRQFLMERRPNMSLGHLRLWSGDFAAARTHYDFEYHRAIDEGQEIGLPMILWGFAQLELQVGNVSRAEELVAQGYEAAAMFTDTVPQIFMTLARAMLHAHRGRVADARQDVARCIERGQELGVPQFVGGVALWIGSSLELSLGDPAAAHEWLAPFTEVVLGPGVWEPAMVPFVPDEIEALARLGAVDAAQDLLENYEARAFSLGRQSAIGAAGRCRGLLLAARGDTVSALRVLEGSLSCFESLGLPLERARTLLIAGEVNRRARRKGAAKEVLTSALESFEDLGAPLWAERVREQLERIGIHPGGSAASRELTDGERQVAELVVAGRTNREAAAELFMAVRTLEAHLSRIYRKLGVRSRTELGRVFSSQKQ